MPRISKKLQLLNPNVLVQLADSEQIFEDIQSGTVTHTFEASGNPQEAYASGVFDGKQLGNGHEWFRNSHLVSRRFVPMAPSSNSTKRTTKVTLVYKRGVCPTDVTIQLIAQTTPTLTWWSFDDPPKLMEPRPSGVIVVRPTPMLIIHIPLVRESLTGLAVMAEFVGHTNDSEFLGKNADYWLFEDMKVRQLWGSVPFVDEAAVPRPPDLREFLPAWEMTLFLRGDKFRHHKRFAAKYDGPNILVPAGGTFVELAATHIVTTVHPQTEFDMFNSFINKDACRVVHDDQ